MVDDGGADINEREEEVPIVVKKKKIKEKKTS